MAYSPNNLQALLVAQANVDKNIIVAEEPVGVLNSINMKFNDKRVSINEPVFVPIVPVGSLDSSPTPSATPPSGTSVTPVNAKVIINYLWQGSMVLTGEDQMQLENIDTKAEILRQFLQEKQRLIRNSMAASAGQALAISASRAVGTAGVTPFSRDFSTLTKARKNLRVTNGSPYLDVNLVTNGDAYENALNLNVVQQAQQAGSDDERRSGSIMRQLGCRTIVEDAFLPTHTLTGVGAAYTNNGALVKGQTSITLQSGAATDYILYGDYITIATDTTDSGSSAKYMVVPPPGTDTNYPSAQSVAAGSFVTNQPYTITGVGTTSWTSLGATSNTVGVTFIANGPGTGTGIASVAGYLGATPTIYIGNPGIRMGIATGQAITIGSAYTPSYLFEKNSVVGIARPPAGFDDTVYTTPGILVTDVLGFTYNYFESKQWGQLSWFLQMAGGFADLQNEYNMVLLG